MRRIRFLTNRHRAPSTNIDNGFGAAHAALRILGEPAAIADAAGVSR